MAGLAPPPVSRTRASSTNVRPALTLSSLGSRRRSNSALDLPPPTPSPPTPLRTPAFERNAPPLSLAISTKPSQIPDSMLSVLLARVLDLLRFAPHTEPTDESTPSSPRLSRSSTSSEDSILPISSPIVSTFPQSISEKPVQAPRAWWKGTPSVHTPVLFVILMFPLSTALVLFSLSTLPITLSWPQNLTDLAQLGRELHGYSQSGLGPLAHVVAVISVSAVWKHAWSIPGSVIWNVLAGALFSPFFATLLLTTLTTIGSICASLLSAPLAPFLVGVFPRVLAMTRSALEGSSSSDSASLTQSPKSSAWVRLSILRLVGIVPWAGLNVACGVCGVALRDCLLGSFVGTLPWTAVTCQIGDILQTVASTPSPTPQSVQSLLTSPEILTKLVFLTVLSLAPILGRDYLRRWISPSENSLEVPSDAEERVSRWTWVKEWRTKIRMPSPSRSKELLMQEIQSLTREKEQSLPL